MDKESKNLQYERAARIRDMISTVQKTISQQIIHSRFYQDCDAVGFASREDRGSVTILHAKNGVIQGKADYPLIHRGDISESVACVLSEHYTNRKPPKTLLIPSPLGSSMKKWLDEKEERVRLR